MSTAAQARRDKGQWIEAAAGDDPAGRRYLSLPESGSGPGLVLLCDAGGIDAHMRGKADLFAEEGYVVLACAANARDDAGDALTALRARDELDGDVGALGYGVGAALVLDLAADGAVAAAVAIDPPAIDERSLAARGCPITIQIATAGDDDRAALYERFAGTGEVTVHGYPDAVSGFTFPGHPSYDKPASRIAHTRILEPLRAALGPKFDLVAIFREHLRHEFETRDADATMRTMVDDPYVNHVPTLTGGVGHDMLKRFYKYHFIPQNPADRRSVHVSYTVGVDRLVIETVASFTHDMEIDYMFPGVPPTGRRVEIPIVLLVNFRGAKVCHEHIYWDQGSALAQLGLIDPTGLPISGPEQAHKLLDEEQPSNFLMKKWKLSADKPI